MTSKPASQPDLARVGDGDSDIMSATFGYLGAIFLGPVIPLAVYLLRSRRSSLPRSPPAPPGNPAPTAAPYGLCLRLPAGLLPLVTGTATPRARVPVPP